MSKITWLTLLTCVLLLTACSSLGIIKSFEECEAAGYPVTLSQPPQCRTPEGGLFILEGEEITSTGTGTVQPDDSDSGVLSSYPDLQLEPDRDEPVSVRYVAEHRSALSGNTVVVEGVVVYALLGEDACPTSGLMGMCAQPRVIIADSLEETRDQNYDLTVILAEEDVGYEVGQNFQAKVSVEGDATYVMARKTYS